MQRAIPTHRLEEYKRQVAACASWMETTLDVSFSPESITSYTMEQYGEIAHLSS
jgi:hypothetical protein